MTPQEKAKELIEKYCQVLLGKERYVSIMKPIQCALIEVDEILNELQQLRKPEYTTFIIEYGDPGITMDGYEKIDYWQQVKDELLKP